MNRFQASFLYLLLTLGIILNVCSLVYFKFKVSSYYSDEALHLRNQVNDSFLHFSTDTLRRIDLFLSTNVVNRANITNGVSAGSASRPSPFFEVVDRGIEFSYFISDGRAYVDFRGDYLTVGDTFPRGGTITAISRDSIQVDNRYIFINSTQSSFFLQNNTNSLGRLKR